MHARIAWAVLVLTTFAFLLDTAFTAAHRPLLSEVTWADHGWPLAPLSAVGCALMGALIVRRYPRQPLGWLLSVASLLSVTLAAEAYSIWVLAGDGPGSDYWAHVAAWASPVLGWPAFTALILIFLMAPDGRLASPRWRWAFWVTVVGLGLHTLGSLTIDPTVVVYGEDRGYRPVSGPLLSSGVLLVAAGLVASAVSLAVRLRRAQHDERRQLLWITSAAVLLALGVLAILLVPRLQGEEGTWLAALPLRLAQVAVPLCVAVAVLRHRLLQIDLIVSRALVLALATGLVSAGYVVVVVALGVVLGGGTSGFWPSLLATAAVALAFQPIRRRVVHVADRLAFGTAASPYRALADFSRRLGDSPLPAVLLPSVAEAAAQAVGASHAVVRLHLEGGPDEVALWPPSGTDARPAGGVAVPVVDRGQTLGSITVAMPPGRPLRHQEHELLADLADQAGLAFLNARLTLELSARVDQLTLRNDELSDSRRRLITSADEERSRLERAITREVVPHLAPLPTRLRQLSRSDLGATPGQDVAPVGPLVESLSRALEALREITRGVFPAQLVRSGLPAALRSLLGRAQGGGHLAITDHALGRRFSPETESAAYFCAVEAVRELGTPVVVLDVQHDRLHLTVTGGDRGDLPLAHMRDRVQAAGGELSTAGHDGHTVIDLWGPPPDAPTAVTVPADRASGADQGAGRRPPTTPR